VTIDQQGLMILGEAECADLLGTASLGRIALTNHALPIILPVAFVCDGRNLLFNVGPGLLWRAAEAGQIVCFQTDSGAEDLLNSWSVSAIGQLSVVASGIADSAAAQPNVTAWSTEISGLVRLTPQIFSGRRRAA
jgi:uncharacterized protein